MPTLVEFMAPVAKAGNRERCLAVLYYAQFVECATGLATNELRARLVEARVAKAKVVNVADVLTKAGHYVERLNDKSGSAKRWRLTGSGKSYIEKLVGILSTNQAAEDVTSLKARSNGIKDELVRSYVDEAIICLQATALRAAVVFLWTGAMRKLQEDLFAAHEPSSITNALQKHDPRVRAVMRIEDLANVKDKVALLAMRDLGQVDKGEWATLQEALDLRNRCGHPTSYRPGEKKASSFIEDLIGIVFRQT